MSFVSHQRPASGSASRDDVIAVSTLLLLVGIATGFRFEYDNWLSGFDTFPFFLPYFGYMGDRLREFEIPAWNPYFFSGAPMAGDAGGGWMYLHVMAAFTLFSAVSGIKVMVLIQTVIGGLATYAFGRRIGLVPLAALFSGTALAIGPMLYAATGVAPVTGQISPFIAVGLLGVECGLRARRLSSQLGWSALVGIAISQMVLVWPQGAVYGTMTIGGWMLYRLVGAPPRAQSDKGGSRLAQLQRFLTVGLAAGILAVAFGAAGILPRIDFSNQSSIAGSDYSGVIGGDYATATPTRIQLIGWFIQESLSLRIVEHNSAILILALLGLLMGRNRFGIPFFAIATLVFLDLASMESLTRDMLSLIPAFERVHGHRPTATMYMTFLPLAMLGGSGLNLLLAGVHRRSPSILKLLPFPVFLLALITVERTGVSVGTPQLLIATVATLLILLPTINLPARWRGLQYRLPEVAGIGLLALILIYPSGMDFVNTIKNPTHMVEPNYLLGRTSAIEETVETVMAREDPEGAGAFLQRQRDLLQPFRYASYFGNVPDASYNSSAHRRMEPGIVEVLANGRSARLGLEQVSGYNPLHLKNYDDYFTTMNAARQNYHWLDLFAPALSGTPLLDMLNVRYVLVPATLDPQPAIAEWGAIAWRDTEVIVYENPNALPRAWIVHNVYDNKDGEGLLLLNSGLIDPRQVAFVDGPLPEVATPTGSHARDNVTVLKYAPERIEMTARSSASGLLVVSEVYASGWNAYVDGERVEILRTNHALRGVPLDAGEHEVILRYEPRSLTIGLWSTSVASVAMLGIWAWAFMGWRRRVPGTIPEETPGRADEATQVTGSVE